MGFYILGTFIPYYGFCIVIGLVCAFFISYCLCKKYELDTDNLFIICSYFIVFGFLGAKILYIIVSFKSLNYKSIFRSVKAFNFFLSSGFVFYGGLIGGILSLPLINKVHKIEVNKYIPCIVPGFCVAHSFGRIGCSLAGCCHGKVTQGHLYFLYKHSIIAPNNVKLFPVQGIEASCIFLVGIICFIIVWKKIKLNVAYIYVILYSVLRFILEFFRGDIERGIYLGFSTSQIVSMLLIVFLLLWVKKIKKHFL